MVICRCASGFSVGNEVLTDAIRQSCVAYYNTETFTFTAVRCSSGSFMNFGVGIGAAVFAVCAVVLLVLLGRSLRRRRAAALPVVGEDTALPHEPELGDTEVRELEACENPGELGASGAGGGLHKKKGHGDAAAGDAGANTVLEPEGRSRNGQPPQ